jgi:hypothetical protein
MCKKCIKEGLVTNCSACIVKFKKMAKELSREEVKPQINTARTNTIRMNINKRSDTNNSNLHR